jgi:hypothetical protein
VPQRVRALVRKDHGSRNDDVSSASQVLAAVIAETLRKALFILGGSILGAMGRSPIFKNVYEAFIRNSQGFDFGNWNMAVEEVSSLSNT